MANIKLETLKQISYFNRDLNSLSNRIVHLGPFLNDSNQWEMWLPTGEDTLVKIAAGAPIESIYFSKKPAVTDDIYLHFFDLFVQRLNFKNTKPALYAFLDDLYNMGASLQKMNLFYELSILESKYSTTEISKFVSTEVEYYFMLLRSLFDIFQEIVSNSFSNFHKKLDNSRFKQLPTSFAKMVLRKGELLCESEIAGTFDLPIEIANIYSDVSELFITIRSFRDLIAHRGESPSHIFVSDKGFLVNTDRTPFKNEKIWRDVQLEPNNLGNINFALSFYTHETIKIFELLALQLSRIVDLPPPMTPELKTYIRSGTNKGLNQILLLR